MQKVVAPLLQVVTAVLIPTASAQITVSGGVDPGAPSNPTWIMVNLDIGNSPVSPGSVHVSEDGEIFAYRSLRIASFGSGTLTVDGGDVRTEALTMGSMVGTAVMTVNGGRVESISSIIGHGTSAQAKIHGGEWQAGSLTVGSSSSGTLEIAGSGVVTASTIEMGGVSGHGTVLLKGGTLKAEKFSKSVGTASVTFDGGTLHISKNASEIFSSFAAGDVSLSSGGGTIDVPAAVAATTHQNLNGEGALTKTGAGTLVLEGTNGYTGGTTVKAGTLSFTSSASLGASTEAVTLDGGTLHNRADLITDRSVVLGSNNGRFDVDAGYLTLLTPVTGAGGLAKAGSNILTLVGDQTYAGATLVSGGAFKVQSGSLASNSVTVAAGATFYLEDVSSKPETFSARETW